MEVSVFGDPVIVQFGSLPITRAIMTAYGVSLVLALVGLLLGRATGGRSNTLPVVIAHLAVEFPERLVTDIVGREVPWLAVLVGSIFYFLTGCSIAGQLPGMRNPTSNLAVTSALAVLIFVTVPVAGIGAQGWRGYLRHYVWPNPLMLPLELLSELSRTFALSLRLFGNMLSGYLIVAMVVALVGVIIPMPLMALDLLIGLLQAYIFAVLSTVYIGAAIRAQETS